MTSDLATAWGLAVALGCGLLIGVERERRKGSGPGRAAAGVRSFAVAASTGALADWIGVPGMVVAGAVLVALLSALAYAHSVRAHRGVTADPGLTTELALFATYLIGVMCVRSPALGAASGVGLAALLAGRDRMHRFATHWLSERELHDGLLLAALALIGLPLVPAGPIAWLGGIELRPVLVLIVLILVLQAVAHVVLRVLGPRGGLPLMGLISGFVSSTATVATLGREVRTRPGQAVELAAAAGLSGSATWMLSMMVVATLSPSSVPAVLPMMVAGAVAPAAVAWWLLRAAPDAVSMALISGTDGPAVSGAAASIAPAPAGGPLRLREAVWLGVALVGLSAAVGAGTRWFGAAAAYPAAALAALADAHAAVAALASLAQAQTLSGRELGLGVLIAIGTNTAIRIVVSALAGGAVYAGRVAAALATSALAAAGAWVLTG